MCSCCMHACDVREQPARGTDENLLCCNACVVASISMYSYSQAVGLKQAIHRPSVGSGPQRHLVHGMVLQPEHGMALQPGCQGGPLI